MGHESRTRAWCLHGESLNDDDLYVMINASSDSVNFGIFEGAVGEWNRVIDTSLASPDDICDHVSVNRRQPMSAGSDHSVTARSVVVLVRKRNLP